MEHGAWSGEQSKQSGSSFQLAEEGREQRAGSTERGERQVVRDQVSVGREDKSREQRARSEGLGAKELKTNVYGLRTFFFVCFVLFVVNGCFFFVVFCD